MAYQRILVPVDGSATSQRGLQEAIALARLTGGRLRLLHVVDELSFATGFETGTAFLGDVIPLMREAGQAVLQQACTQAETAGVPAEPVLCDRFATRVCDAVTQEARQWRADLIVLGTHGRRGVGRLLLGSDAEQVLRLAQVPVLLVRAPQEAQPGC
ncbi:MAG: universal stress protein [Aquincola sp.]|nr:universal stress protein [Aquincola sp.]